MRSHSASKSLIYVINDLLDLTRTEEGQELVMNGIFNLSNTVHEAISPFKSSAERKNISLVVVEYPGLPRLVRGDQSRLRQAVSNVVGNAVKNTDVGGVRVEVWMPEALNNCCQVEIAIQDTGVGISPKRLDMLFREFEQVQTEDEREEPPRTGQTIDRLSRVTAKKVLGLGLAVVARTIRNMNGQLRLRSEEGKGSRFTIIIPFTLPSEREQIESGVQSLTLEEPSPQPQSTTPPPEQDPAELLPANLSPQNQPSPNRTMERDNNSGLGSQDGRRDESNRTHVIMSPNKGPRALRPITSKPSLLSKSGSMGPRSPSPPGPAALNPQPTREAMERSTMPPKVQTQEKYAPTSGSEASPNTPIAQSYGKPLNCEEPTETRPLCFKVLVAEDDPINTKIIKKRMERLGHEVSLTVNGAECVDSFMKNNEEYDIVLMDMQVGIPLAPLESSSTIRSSTRIC